VHVNGDVRRKDSIVGLSLLIAIILLIVVLGGIFSYRINASYQMAGGFVAAIAALLLFLMAVNVIHI
jgi:hypothetical protein